MRDIDILKLIYNKEISMDEVYDLIDGFVELAHQVGGVIDPENKLNLSKREWQASAFGVPWEDIALWCYEGWPETCFRCGHPIFYDIQYILYKHGRPRHVGCKEIKEKVTMK